MRKRIVSIVLALCMVLALMPQTAFAEGAGTSYILKEGTAGAGATEGPKSLIDGNSSTKWCVTNFNSAYIIFSTDSPVKVSGYNITTGNDNTAYHGRNPKNWTLYGCNDYTKTGTEPGTGTWEKIHSVTNDTILKDEDKSTYKFAFDNTETEYQYYKLQITAIQSGDVMQMSEFALTSCEHDWSESITTAPTCTAAGYLTRTCSKCSGTDSVCLKPVDHDFTGEGGTCRYCGDSYDVLRHGYVDENGILRKQNENIIPVTDALTTWKYTAENAGWYIAHGDVTIGSNVSVSGDVHLILADGCTLTVNGNIQGGSLTIYGQSGGTGNLIVSGSITSGSGGNGSDDHSALPGGSGGNITINGGMIKADNIKSGNGGNGENDDDGSGGIGGSGGKAGNITINGGVIEADSISGGTGGSGGNGGIGNNAAGTGGEGGNITINGGVIEADSISGGTGGSSGKSGIGDYGTGGTGGGITINGGIVEVVSITGGTGGNGHNATNGSVSITDGVVFQNGSGQVYGGDVTLSESLEIPSGKALTIKSKKTLTIPAGKTLSIEDGGTLSIEAGGTLINNGKIYVGGTVSGTVSGDGEVYYHLSLTNCTANSTAGMETHDEKTYGKAGSEITLTPDTPPTGYKFSKWNFTPDVTISETNTFTMPSAAITVTAQFSPDTYTVTLNTNGGTINSGDVTEYTYGQGATLPTDVTKAGYSFKGWYENDTFTGNPVTVIGNTETGEKTFYAKWAANGYYPISQTPTIESGEGVKVTLSADGKTATITAFDGYEIADVMLNGVSLGKVTEVKNLKTGDKLVVTVEKKEAEPTKEEILAALADQELTARSKLVTMKNGKKAIKITWYNEDGEMIDFDGVEIYRSTKRYSGYGKKPFFTTEKDAYYNTAIKEGTKYYYKVRGFVIIDGQKCYTDYSLKAIRTVK